MPQDIAATQAEPGPFSPAAAPDATQAAAPSRWSGDAWLAWRAGGRALPASGAALPVYGASQAGAVLRYALSPAAKMRPSAYVRVVGALDARESDVAAGMAVRPLAAIPLTINGEARLARRGAEVAFKPAVFASAGVDAVPLAAGVRGRGYAQAGFVGGRGATVFADGSLTAEKPVWRAQSREFSAGAGVWGGAQRGAGRLDIGPSLALRVPLGSGAARLSADYRLRVAGNAAPSSGAALTLAAGF